MYTDAGAADDYMLAGSTHDYIKGGLGNDVLRAFLGRYTATLMETPLAPEETIKFWERIRSTS